MGRLCKNKFIEYYTKRINLNLAIILNLFRKLLLRGHKFRSIFVINSHNLLVRELRSLETPQSANLNQKWLLICPCWNLSECYFLLYRGAKCFFSEHIGVFLGSNWEEKKRKRSGHRCSWWTLLARFNSEPL